MATNKASNNMKKPSIVSQQEWEAAHKQMLVKEKAFTRSRDALAAERRRMPWMAVEKNYQFDGPEGKVSLLDLFEGGAGVFFIFVFFFFLVGVCVSWFWVWCLS